LKFILSVVSWIFY